jgi:peptide/nickel transport system substrate-binding protein
MRANPKIAMEVNIYPSRFIVEFNMAQAPFDDLKLRQAVSMAIDRDEMLSIALKEVGLKADHFLSPLFGWAVDDSVTVPGYDLEAAQTLMAESGLGKDADGYYLHISLDTMNYSPFPDLAQVLKSQLDKIGIDVTINMLEYASFDEKVVKNKDFALGLTSDYQGPEVSAIGNSVSSTGYMNCTGYSNPDVDKLLADALNLATFEERAPLYKQVQAYLAADLPYTVLSEWIGYYPHWDYVKGHPGSEEANTKAGNGEFTYVWLDK